MIKIYEQEREGSIRWGGENKNRKTKPICFVLLTFLLKFAEKREYEDATLCDFDNVMWLVSELGCGE